MISHFLPFLSNIDLITILLRILVTLLLGTISEADSKYITNAITSYHEYQSSYYPSINDNSHPITLPSRILVILSPYFRNMSHLIIMLSGILFTLYPWYQEYQSSYSPAIRNVSHPIIMLSGILATLSLCFHEYSSHYLPGIRIISHPVTPPS